MKSVRSIVLSALAVGAAVAAVACSPTAALQSRADLVSQLQAAAPAALGAGSTTSVAVPTPAPTPAPTATPTLNLEQVKPNELGTVPILEYHVIANAEEDQWTRTPAHFREDLQKLYDAGFRPISLSDYLNDEIDLPAGSKPVVISFDDSSPGQFRFIQQDGQVVVDPDCAVGMLEAFHASHPDFAVRAAFSVLPEAAEPHKLFGQKEYETQKLQYLVAHGMELANHTWWHQQLDIVNDQEVQRQLANAVRDVEKAVPGYKMHVLTLPLGMWPKNRPLALDGSYEGTTYHNDAILLVGAEPAPSPNSVNYDPLALPRVQVFDGNLDRWLKYLADNPDDQYVSDGDPTTITFPQHLESQLAQGSVGNKKVQSY